ncbi:MAG TPA: serine/threonine-protein kinase, partial [Bacteroidota bacterium]|nr:serine/threonine-protein kinase [Bacteroidota bacterium]
MIGRTVSHYTILDKLGEGGMGVVYRARDLTLNRVVALKFLPPHIGGDPDESARLLQEARTASGLNHPGICTIHAIGEHEGAHFIDLEFVDGRTLGNILGQGGLPLERALDYALQICDALQEAHANGIVHRDIKSENVMVTARDRIKVMDFGLAKLKGSAKLTRPLSTVGTLAYMAPEVVQGGEADARSDLFSAGVLLYEMLAGSLPFRGDHEAAVIYSIAHGTPEPLSRLRREVTPDLERIVNRALEKDPAKRYQTAAEMGEDLKRVGKSTPLPLSPPPRESTPPSRVVPGKAARFNLRSAILALLGVLVIVAAWVFYRNGP